MKTGPLATVQAFAVACETAAGYPRWDEGHCGGRVVPVWTERFSDVVVLDNRGAYEPPAVALAGAAIPVVAGGLPIMIDVEPVEVPEELEDVAELGPDWERAVLLAPALAVVDEVEQPLIVKVIKHG